MYLRFWLKTSILYAIIAFGFSLLTLTVQTDCNWCEVENPNLLESELIIHMLGHSAFGMLVAIPTWRIKYIISGGLFVVALDFDHVLRYIVRIIEDNIVFTDLGIDLISRSGHSIMFGLIVAIIIMMVYGRKDYLLGAVSGAAVFGHMAFDTFGNTGVFPLLMPFTNEVYYFSQESWILMMVTGLSIVMLGKTLTWRKEYLEKQLSTN